mmetsp:Transcript_19542/g.61215  ORF Transcript_19542/g.61215 Transcript_19542/m.61215 type:complete len:309 (+) Transcript_19542:172-1098(+)
MRRSRYALTTFASINAASISSTVMFFNSPIFSPGRAFPFLPPFLSFLPFFPFLSFFPFSFFPALGAWRVSCILIFFRFIRSISSTWSRISSRTSSRIARLANSTSCFCAKFSDSSRSSQSPSKAAISAAMAVVSSVLPWSSGNSSSFASPPPSLASSNDRCTAVASASSSSLALSRSLVETPRSRSNRSAPPVATSPGRSPDSFFASRNEPCARYVLQTPAKPRRAATCSTLSPSTMCGACAKGYDARSSRRDSPPSGRSARRPKAAPRRLLRLERPGSRPARRDGPDRATEEVAAQRDLRALAPPEP